MLECGGHTFRIMKVLVKAEEHGPLIVAPLPSQGGWRFTDHPSGFSWISKGLGPEREVACRFDHRTDVEQPRELIRRLWAGAAEATMLDVYHLPPTDAVTRRVGKNWVISIDEVVDHVSPSSRMTLRRVRKRVSSPRREGLLVVDRRRGIAVIVTHAIRALVGIPFGWGRGRARVRATNLWEQLIHPVSKALVQIGEEEGSSWLQHTTNNLPDDKLVQADRAFHRANKRLRKKLSAAG